MSIIQPIKKQRLALSDKYKEYLALGAKPKDNFSNPLNLFDDSNRKDKVWLKSAKKYLSRVK